MQAVKKYAPSEVKKLEDEILKMVDEWPEEKRATVYFVLYSQGMRLDKARQIRHAYGLSGN